MQCHSYKLKTPVLLQQNYIFTKLCIHSRIANKHIRMAVQEGKWSELGMEILLKRTHESRKRGQYSKDNKSNSLAINNQWPTHWSMLCLYSGEIQNIWREQEVGPQLEWSNGQVLCGEHMVWSWVMVLGVFCAPLQIFSPPLCTCSAPRKQASKNSICLDSLPWASWWF